MTGDSVQLEAFISAAKARGVSDEFVVTLLRQNGWSERRIYQAYTAYYEGALGAPLPSRGGRVEYAGEAFLYLLAFISLAFWATALWSLITAVIDRHFPNPAEYAAASFRETVTLQLAALIVAFPIFVWVSRSIARRLSVHPEAADSGVRAWLTYVALTIAAVIALGDTVYFVASFLHGDITVRLVLKTAVILLITGGIISYYMNAMRGAALAPARDRAYMLAALLSVVVGLGFGFFDTGSPQYQHSVSLDERRISDLNSLRIQLNDAKALPATLDGLPSLQYSGSSRTDPVTKRPYEYTRTGKKSFMLCATFDTADQTRSDGFNHAAGRVCFKN